MPHISFDRVADVYDATRGHPPEVSQAIAASVAALLPPGASLLEVGIGTGRIARPLMARGLNITGIDLSPYMMKRLLESLPPGAARPLLAQADAVWLPFPAGAFQAVTSIHVFHLIAEWQQSLREIVRVLEPGGIFLTGFDWRDRESPASLLND
jgi:ubiquinone/menaquinone biosynthesis C-methylase UbiE